MKPLEKKIILNNGNEIPLIGLGTYKIESQKNIQYILKNAIDIGYRYFDLAPVYQNQWNIGEYFLSRLEENKFDFDLHRSDLFISSKIWNTHHRYVKGSVQKTLLDLKTDYLDLLLIHWPVTFSFDVFNNNVKRDKNDNPILEEFKADELWELMERQIDKEWVRSIGVSNFGIKNISKILESCRIKPAVNQIECHPYFQNRKVIDFCKKEGINVVAYSPLGGESNKDTPDLRKDPIIQGIAQKYSVSTAKIILSYTAISKGIPIIPRSNKVDHLKENVELINLESKDVEILDSLERNFRFIDPVSFGKYRFD